MNSQADILAKRLREAMAAKDLTIQEVADKSGISSSGLKRWLAGTGVPRSDNLQRVADTLGVTWDWLLGLPDALPTPVAAAGGGFAEGQSLGLAAADSNSARLSKTVDLFRLVDAFDQARDRLGPTINRKMDSLRMMELTLLLYDALTVSADLMRAHSPTAAADAPPAKDT